MREITVTLITILAVVTTGFSACGEEPVQRTPNIDSFQRSAQVAAANSEVASVEAAASAYYAANGNWPSNTNIDLVSSGFLRGTAVYDYSLDDFGRVVVPDGTAWPNDSGVIWSATEHKWHR